MFTLQLYFRTKPQETNKPQAAPTDNGLSAPGASSRPLPPPPQAPPPLPQTRSPPPGAPSPPRGYHLPLDQCIPSSPMGNGPGPMSPGGNLLAPPPPPVGGGAMTNFTPGVHTGRPPITPSQGFPGQPMQGQVMHPPPNMGC